MCAATQMAVAVHETLSPFMTEMREGLAAVKTEIAAVKTEMATMKRNLRVMEGKVNQTTVLGMLDAKLAPVESMKEDIKDMKTQLNEHKDSFAEELESLLNNQNSFDLKLDLLDAKQDILDLKQDRLAHRVTVVTSALEARILSNTTRELRRSGENHVTSIESQLTSVDAGIRNELRKIERQITRNSTESERVELEILSHEELLETLAAVNTSISGQVSYIKEDLGHISSSVDRVIDGLGECMVTGEQNCSSQPLEECTCDIPVEQNCPEPARPSLDDCQDICDLNCTCHTLMENCQRQDENRSDYECGGTGGWRRVVYLNMTDPNTNCPIPWVLTSHSKRTCGRASTCSRSCDSVFFPVSGGDYTSVCGSIRAYQYAYTRAFEAYDDRSVTTIEGAYVSGISLTHGGPRQHIWTFAAGLTEAARPTDVNVCPCDTSFDIRNPPFMGDDYFCESGVNSGYRTQRLLYPDDPLWDGEGCSSSSSSSSCCSFNNPPYFTKQLPSPTSDSIEARLCGYDGITNEDTPVEFMEIYVK